MSAWIGHNLKQPGLVRTEHTLKRSGQIAGIMNAR
jgi:hypothetical protein